MPGDVPRHVTARRVTADERLPTVDSAVTTPAPVAERSRAPWGVWAFLAMTALAFAPLLEEHGEQLWRRPHYQFFPMALLGVAWLALSRWGGLGRLEPGRPALALAALAAGWVLLAGAAAINSSWLAAAALPPTLAACAYAVGGGPLLKRMLPALVLLAVLLPPPLDLDRHLMLLLQRKTTHWSSQVLDLLGVFHVMAGNVVEVGGQRLLVEEACSGITSLFVVVAATIFFIFQAERPALWAVPLFAAAVAWVLLANVARVVVLTVLKVNHGIDLTEGWRHEALGFLLFGTALLMIWSTDRFLRFLLTPSLPLRPLAPDQEEDEPEEEPTVLPDLSRRRLGAWALAAAFALVVALQWDSYGFARGAGNTPPAPADLSGLSVDTLPRAWGPWERDRFATETRNPGSYFGEVSKAWTYTRGQNMAAFSLDYPFPFWHDLTYCYTSQGWVVDGQTVHPGGEGEAGYVEVALVKPTYRTGYLLFAQYDARGRPLEARPGGARLSLHRHGKTLDRLRQRLLGEAPPEETEEAPVYQAQLFVETPTPLTPQEQAQAREFFLQALARVTASLVRE